MSAYDHTKWQERKLENEFDINVKVMGKRNIRMCVFFMRCLTHICVSFIVFFASSLQMDISMMTLNF